MLHSLTPSKKIILCNVRVEVFALHQILILTTGRYVLMEHLSRAVLQRRDLMTVSIHGGCAGFPYKHY